VVFNRVKGINQVTDALRQLVPEVSIQAAHGQMAEGRLEDIMQSFMDNEFDVLVATTIIESGIDVPNANTLIILDADNFGLAQLYQLKGRVGRSNKAAYAYFMYKKDKILSEVATKRLRAIKEFTEFGSGFRIAMKDLEIRGAGNLLGTEQSGHMMQIGYELYCKLIDDAVRKLRGEKVPDGELEVSLEIKVDAFISSDYIEDEKLKLDMYKRIAEIRSSDDMSDVTDELTDRFGEIPPETVSLMYVSYIQAKCKEAGIKRAALDEGKVLFEFVPDNNALTPEIIAKLTDVYGMKLIISMGKQPYIKMPFTSRNKLLQEITDFLISFE
jgi:transcription-repair coupling factor (superfamily II helicase)